VVSSKAAEKKLADLWTESVEATADLKRLDDQIKQAKVEIGVAIVAGKAADNSKLTSLLEKRDELGMRLNALAKKIQDTQAELAEAKAVERTAAIEAYKAESAKQVQMSCG